jgi:hypothetical protein
LKQGAAPPPAAAVAIQRRLPSNRGAAQRKTDDYANEHNAHDDHDNDRKHPPHDESGFVTGST